MYYGRTAYFEVGQYTRRISPNGLLAPPLWGAEGFLTSTLSHVHTCISADYPTEWAVHIAGKCQVDGNPLA